MYTKVESQFWRDEKMKPASDEAKLLMFYLLTSPHKNLIGFYYLPHAYGCADLKWSQEKYKSALQELIDLDRIVYDDNSEVVLIKNHLKYNPIQNQNQAKAAIEKFNELPKTTDTKPFAEALAKNFKPFMQPLRELLQQRLGQPVEVTVTDTVKVTGEGTLKKPIPKFEKILLTDEELEILIKTYGKDKIYKYIEKMHLWILSKGHQYDNHYAALLKWIKEDEDKKKTAAKNNSPNKGNFEQRTYEESFLDSFYANK